MITSKYANPVALTFFTVFLLGAAPPPKPSFDELQFVDWVWPYKMTSEERARAQFREPTEDDLQARLVEDAQALLIRAAVLSMAASKEADVDTAWIVARVADDCKRIAAARPGDRYIQSHAFARADLSLPWLPERGKKEPDHSRRIGIYLIAFVAMARDAEERAINPNGLVLEWNSSWPSGPDDPTSRYTPPENTDRAREIADRDLRAFLAGAGVSAQELADLDAAFAEQSLGGAKYILELRDKLGRNTAP